MAPLFTRNLRLVKIQGYINRFLFFYCGRRLYQYKKTTFDFNFDLYPALNSMNKQNMETKRSCKLKYILFNYLSTCNIKKAR